ncbi:MAG: RdgB/HAM1 family non-canonical purine NTP pyrophosphatase [Candidatus Omnitrophota bacterium]
MTRILVATHNAKKRCELKTLLKSFKGTRVMNLDDLDVQPPIIVEDGKTFRQNAVKKAVTISRFFDGLVLADDSGLEVDALDGRPGVRSARFARVKATDIENNRKLIKLLGNVPEKNRHARFVCHIALARKGILLGTFEGAVKGKILFTSRGRNGFGYDPLFVPRRHEKTFAEMAASYKNQISHRSLALKKLKRSIQKYLKNS